MSTMEQVTQQEKRPSTMQVFMQGAGKGLNVVVKSMLPAIVMAYAVITILENIGILELIGKVCDPFMALFGLPGVAITCILTGFMNKGGGVATALSLLATGSLTVYDATVLVMPIMILGGFMQQYIRIVVVGETLPRHRKYIILITVVMTFVSIWIMHFYLKLVGM